MSGNKLFFDTNGIIAILKGNPQLIELCASADWIGTSSICVIEFFSFPRLSLDDAFLFTSFLERVEIVGLTNNAAYLEDLASFRQENNLKVPDAIIAGYAIQKDASLVTNDKHFKGIKKLKIINFELT